MFNLHTSLTASNEELAKVNAINVKLEDLEQIALYTENLKKLNISRKKSSVLVKMR